MNGFPKYFGLVVWTLLWILLTPNVGCKLLGDHICQTEISVPQEVLKWELQNRTTRTYKWCMNVPPRCSVYSTKLVNESRIVVVNIRKQAESCCEGFKEQSNFCVSECQNCQNGLCLKGACVCQIGWTGPFCDTRVLTSTAFPSTTTRTTADAKNATTATTLRENPKQFEKSIVNPLNMWDLSTKLPIFVDKKQTTEVSSTHSSQEKLETMTSSKIDHTELHNINTTSPKTYVIFTIPFNNTMFPTKNTKGNPITTPKPSYQNTNIPIFEDIINMYNAIISTTTQKSINEFVSSDELEGSGSKIKFRNDDVSIVDGSSGVQFDTTITNSIIISPTDETHLEFKENNKLDRVESDVDYRELDRDIFDDHFTITVKQGLTNTKQKDLDLFSSTYSTLKSTALTKPNLIVNNKIENTIIKENLLQNNDDFSQERFEKRSSVENLNEKTKLTITNEPASKNLIYSICAASLTTFLILVALATLYAVRNSRKKVEKNKNRKEVATVAVYTTSIFHSPLPDPPSTFDNPTYLTTGTNTNHMSQDHQQNIEIQDLNVVIQKPLKQPSLEFKQYVYDHPPSTGSYRASSAVDTLSQYNLSQKSTPGLITEPLYQEIPWKDQVDHIVTQTELNDNEYLRPVENVDTNCLYVNTCGRTKF